jgi:hypothetical protein
VALLRAALLAEGAELRANHLLVAAGCVAQVEGLGLEAAGLAGSARGVATNLALRAKGNRRIWVAGDIADPVGLMVRRRLPLSALAVVVLPYPTMQEAAKRAAGDFYAPKLASPLVKRLLGLLKHLP